MVKLQNFYYLHILIYRIFRILLLSSLIYTANQSAAPGHTTCRVDRVFKTHMIQPTARSVQAGIPSEEALHLRTSQKFHLYIKKKELFVNLSWYILR